MLVNFLLFFPKHLIQLTLKKDRLNPQWNSAGSLSFFQVAPRERFIDRKFLGFIRA